MHAKKHHAWFFILGSLFGLLLTSCAANVGKTIKVSDQQIAKYGTLTAADAIADLERHVNEAMNANMPFLAPDYYRGASEILNEARKSADKKPKNELIGEIAKADAILEKGLTMMAIVQSRLVNELALKIQLDKDNVAKVYPKEYDNAISELSILIEKVELEKSDNLDKDKMALMKSMEALDIKAIQYTALHESDVINEVTLSKDGEKQATATLAEALRVYQDAANRIAQAPHDEALVQRAGAEALFAARHARYVNERVLILQKKMKDAIEHIVLEEEHRLLGISTALGHNDLRDQPVEKQAGEIARVAAEIVQGHQKNKQISDQSKALEIRLKEVNDVMQQNNELIVEKDVQLADNNKLLSKMESQLSERDSQLSEKVALLAKKDTQLSEKDEQLKILNDQIVKLEGQNKSPVKAKVAKPKTTKVP